MTSRPDWAEEMITTISQFCQWDLWDRKASYFVLDLEVMYRLEGSLCLFSMAACVTWLSRGEAFKLAVGRGHRHGQKGMEYLRCILSLRTLLAQKMQDLQVKRVSCSSVCLLHATSGQFSITADMQTGTAGRTADQVSAGHHSMCIWQAMPFPPKRISEWINFLAMRVMRRFCSGARANGWPFPKPLWVVRFGVPL